MSAVTIDPPTVIAYVSPSSLTEHPEAWRIPQMSPEEWADFNESVRVRSAVTDPVFALPDGRVFDGRHRLRSAKENELSALPVITWDITEAEALQRMSEAAVLRRSLRPGQRAAILLEFTEMVERLREEARTRQRQGTRTEADNLAPDLGQGTSGRSATAKALAEKASIGKSSMEYLIAVQREEPELFDRVKAGEITINKAYAETKRRKQPVDKPKPPPKLAEDDVPKSPARAKLEDIKRIVEADEPLEDVPGESTLSPSNLLRYRANGGIMRFAADFCADYEALKGADSETVRQYLIRLKRIIYGSLLIAAEYDESQELRDVFAHMAYLAECALSDEGAQALVTTIQKGGNVA